MASCISSSGEALPLTANFVKCIVDNHTEYEIVIVAPDKVQWTIHKRYREFLELHQQLSSRHSLPSVISFPPKKVLNNTSTAFILQRQQNLQSYLRSILQHYVGVNLPSCLAEFIEWDKYEIHGITSIMAKHFFMNGNTILKAGFPFEFSPLQIYAINQRLKSAAPTNTTDEAMCDFGHVMDFVYSLKSLKIRCSSKRVGDSTIQSNMLQMDLSCFHSLLRLELWNLNMDKLDGFLHLKKSVVTLVVHQSLQNVKKLMLGDLYAIGGGQWVFGQDKVSTTSWEKAINVDLSDNGLIALDPSMALLCKVERLNLAHNRLSDITHLSGLSKLAHLHLSNNLLQSLESALLAEELKLNHRDKQGNDDDATITTTIITNESNGEASSSNSSKLIPNDVDDEEEDSCGLHTKLGNITHLWLDRNGLKSAILVDKLFSLLFLDLSHNNIASYVDIMCLARLPCLERLMLHNNPICTDAEYRINVFDILGDRMVDIILDGEAPTSAEIDLVKVRRALRTGQNEPIENYIQRKPFVVSPSGQFQCYIRFSPSHIPFVPSQFWTESDHFVIISRGGAGGLNTDPNPNSLLHSCRHYPLNMQKNTRLRNYLMFCLHAWTGLQHSISHCIPIFWQNSVHTVKNTPTTSSSSKAATASSTTRSILKTQLSRKSVSDQNLLFGNETNDGVKILDDRIEEHLRLALLVCSAQHNVTLLCLLHPQTESINHHQENSQNSFCFKVEPHHMIFGSAIQQVVEFPVVQPKSSSSSSSPILSSPYEACACVRIDAIAYKSLDSIIHYIDLCYVANQQLVDILTRHFLQIKVYHDKNNMDEEQLSKECDPRYLILLPNDRLMELARFLTTKQAQQQTIQMDIVDNIQLARPVLFHFDTGLVTLLTMILINDDLYFVNEHCLRSPQPIFMQKFNNSRRSRQHSFSIISKEQMIVGGLSSRLSSSSSSLTNLSFAYRCLGHYSLQRLCNLRHYTVSSSSSSSFSSSSSSYFSSANFIKSKVYPFPCFREKVSLSFNSTNNTTSPPRLSTIAFSFRSIDDCQLFVELVSKFISSVNPNEENYDELSIAVPSPAAAASALPPSLHSGSVLNRRSNSITSSGGSILSSSEPFSSPITDLFLTPTNDDQSFLYQASLQPVQLLLHQYRQQQQQQAQTHLQSELYRLTNMDFIDVCNYVQQRCQTVSSNAAAADSSSLLQIYWIQVTGIVPQVQLALIAFFSNSFYLFYENEKPNNGNNVTSCNDDFITASQSVDSANPAWATEVDRDLGTHQATQFCQIIKYSFRNDEINEPLVDDVKEGKEQEDKDSEKRSQCTSVKIIHCYMGMFDLWIRLLINPNVSNVSINSLQYTTFIPHSMDISHRIWKLLENLSIENHLDQTLTSSTKVTTTTTTTSSDSCKPNQFLFQKDPSFELTEMLHFLSHALHLSHPKLAAFCLLESVQLHESSAFSVFGKPGDPVFAFDKDYRSNLNNTSTTATDSSASSTMHQQQQHELCPFSLWCLVVLEQHVCLIELDVVHYPLPTIALQPVNHPAMRIIATEPVRNLQEITISSFDPQKLLMTFQKTSPMPMSSSSSSFISPTASTRQSLYFNMSYYSPATVNSSKSKDSLSTSSSATTTGGGGGGGAGNAGGEEIIIRSIDLLLPSVADRKSLVRKLRKRFSEQLGRELPLCFN